MSKFKVGDKVRVLDGSNIKDYTASWCPATMNRYVGEIHKVKKISSYIKKIVYFLEGCGWYKFDERGLEPVGNKIVITTDGKTTTAVLYDDKKRIKDAKAVCSHDDTFDFGIGAALAVERLMGNFEATLHEDKLDLLNVKIYIVDAQSSSTFETGKIYEIKDGKFTGSASDIPYRGKMKNLDDLGYYLSSESDRGKFKPSCDLSHHCYTGVKYQVLESQ